MVDSEREFLAIHDAFRPRIRRYLAGMVGEAEADDLTQEVFLKASRGLGRFRGDCQVSTWLYRVATNTALDRLRQQSSSPVGLCSLAGDDAKGDPIEIEDRDVWTGEVRPETDQLVIRKEMSQCIRGYVEKLPESYRVAIVLSELMDMKNAEIASVLGISLETVKIRLHRARARLKEALGAGCSFYHDERNELACEPKGSPAAVEEQTPAESVSFRDRHPSKGMERATRKGADLTMKLDDRMVSLVAVGASVAANCQSCLESSVARARAAGVAEREIAEAIGIGKLVRRGAEAKMDGLAASLSGEAAAAATTREKGCGCGH